MQKQLSVAQMATISVLAAMSFLLLVTTKVILIPATPFLKVELSIVPILLCLYWLGYRSALWVLGLRTLLKLVLNNDGGISGYIGMAANATAVMIVLTVFAVLLPTLQHLRNVPRLIAITVLAAVAQAVGMVVLNWSVFLPLYAKFAHFKLPNVTQYLVYQITPFNFVQVILWAAVSVPVILSLSQTGLQRRFMK